MPLMPKRVKFRKNQRGVGRGNVANRKYNGAIKGNAHRGNYVAYGDYGLQSLEGGWLSAESIESGRVTVTCLKLNRPVQLAARLSWMQLNLFP